MSVVAIKDIIHTNNAILQKFGLQVFEQIHPLLQENQTVTVSFTGVDNATTGFFNAAFGKLYKEFGEAYVEKHISFQGIENDDWREKLHDAKQLALHPESAQIIDQAIADLFE